jgi:hypothetical protein
LFERYIYEDREKQDCSKDFYIVLGYDSHQQRPWWNIYNGETRPDRSASGPHIKCPGDSHSRNLSDGTSITLRSGSALMMNRLMQVIEVETMKPKRYEGPALQLRARRITAPPTPGLID